MRPDGSRGRCRRACGSAPLQARGPCGLRAARRQVRGGRASAVRCARRRVVALREPVAVSAPWVAVAGPQLGLRAVPHPTTARERAGKRSSPSAVAECAPLRGPARPAHVNLPAGHAQSGGRVCAAQRGTDGAARVCDRCEGQTAQPADLSREQHAGGAGWPEPRSNTQPERRAWP